MVMVMIVAAGALLAVLVVVMVLVVVVMAAAALVIVVVGIAVLGGQAVELGLEAVLVLHGGAEGLAVQLVPGRGDDDGVLVVLTQHVHAGGELALAHALGAGEHDGPGVFDLIAPELAEVLHVHLGARGVHHGGEGAGHEVRVAHALHGADDVRELADARGLDEDAVRRELRLDLLERLGKVADQAAADAAGAHLGYLHPGVLQKAAVNGDLAELVFDEDQLFAGVGLGDELFDERGLAGAQKAREYVDLSHLLRFLLKL